MVRIGFEPWPGPKATLIAYALINTTNPDFCRRHCCDRKRDGFAGSKQAALYQMV